MSFNGKNPTINSLNLTPGQDPATPSTGELQYANGTDRAAGFYVYTGAAWDSIATSGGITTQTSTKTTTYTITTSDDVILADATSAAFTITLPAANSTPRKLYRIKKIDSTLNAITIDAAGSETIEGSADTTINTQYETITLVPNGTSWFILERRTATPLSAATVLTIGATTTAPTKGTTTTDSIQWYRHGRYARILVKYVQTAAGASGNGVYLISVPTGLVIDTSVTSTNTDVGDILGQGVGVLLSAIQGNANGASPSFMSSIVYNTTQVRFAGTIGGLTSAWDQNSLFLAHNTVNVWGWFDVPIQGWKE